MATAHFDLPAGSPAAPYAAPVAGPNSDAETAPASPNVFLAVLRRWPWLLVGLVGGIAGGLLLHSQRVPVFQSNAQILVIKNRPVEVMNGNGAAAAGVTVVEDYVATQVLLLKSDLVLAPTARKLDGVRLQVPPPRESDRVGFLQARFNVAREKEAGSSAPSTVLALSFKCGDQGDCQAYLSTIIDAYRGELSGIYDEASSKTLASLDANLTGLVENRARKVRDLEEAGRQQRAVTEEDLVGLRGRITQNYSRVSTFTARLIIINNELSQIKDVGPNKSTRNQLFIRLGGKIKDMRFSTAPDANDPQNLLLSLELQRNEMLEKFGKDHPDVRALDSRIRLIQGFIARQNPEDRIPLDDLAIYGITLEQEKAAVELQLTDASQTIKDDEGKARRATVFQNTAERLAGELKELDRKIDGVEGEKKGVLATRQGGGYVVRDVTKPTAGYLVSPILYQSVMIGVVIGLLFGGGLAFLMEFSDRSFRSPAEIRRRLGLPILGHIPRLKLDLPPDNPAAEGFDPSLVSFARPTSTEAEAYRGVRTQLYFSTQGRGHQVIQVTSPNPGDGKSTLAANLAISIAQSGKKTVLIDCDFRKPRVHKIFKLPNPDAGLASVMSGDATLAQAIQPCPVPNLSLLPCGPRPANPAELLTSPLFADMLKKLRESFDFVIVDTPPVLAVSDPSAVAPRVDGVLLVFRMTKNARPVAERAREQLDAVGARVVGVIVNASSARSAGYGGYGYAYQYEYQYVDDYHDDGR